MKIKNVRVVHINAPVVQPGPDTKPGWNSYSIRSKPIARYSEYTRVDGNQPGTVGQGMGADNG